MQQREGACLGDVTLGALSMGYTWECPAELGCAALLGAASRSRVCFASPVGCTIVVLCISPR